MVRSVIGRACPINIAKVAISDVKKSLNRFCLSEGDFVFNAYEANPGKAF